MSKLVIDIGNSFIKIAVFELDEMRWMQQYENIDTRALQQIVDHHHPKEAIISSVKKEKGLWQDHLESTITTSYFNTDTIKGIKNHYLTPHTLGLDRLAGIAGALKLYPEQASMVIDAGTCVTYDVVDKEGNYYGGSISPGLIMRFKALNYYTAALPLVEADLHYTNLYGNNTVTAIQTGVQNGLGYEAKGFIEAYTAQYPQMNIILTGGDWNFFDTLLKNSIFAPYVKNEPHLVLKGLNAVTQQHND
jgi:type III pantothenate kinase